MIKPNFTPQQLEEELIKSANECADKGLAYVIAKAKYDEYDDAKKIKFALLMDTVEPSSIAAKEKEVLKSVEWRKYIRKVVNARTEYLHAQMQYETATRNFDTCRSLLSSKNTERRTYI